MRTIPKVTVVVTLFALTVCPCVLGQAARPPRPAPDRPVGPGLGVGGPGVGLGPQMLKPRPLEDKPLDEKEQKKYDSLLAAMEKRAANTRNASSTSRTTELASAFKLAATQLRYGQEQTARESFDKAWQIVPELYREPKSVAAVTGQIRTHLREIQVMAGKDPELALTLMSELYDAHQKAFEAIEQVRSKGQLAQPLAQTWFQLMQTGQLDKETMDKASYWIMLFPQMAMINRPLHPDQQTDYESQLTAVTVNIAPRLRQLAERQLARSGRPAPPMNLNAGTPDTVDPVTAQAISSLEAKSGPLSEFMKAEIHFNFGQFREGLEATGAAWRGLLEYYRQNPGNVSPADTELHFAALDRIAAANPIQALVVADQLDPMYRNMLRVDRFFGVKVADNWAKLASGLPLAPPMLLKTAFWLDYVGKQHKDMDTKYAATLADVKDKLEQAGIGENEADDGGKANAGANDRKPEKDDEPKGVGGRRGVSIPREIDTTKRAEQK